MLHCHEPADLVFTTNMTSTSLNGYKAVFLVDQWVELDGNSNGTHRRHFADRADQRL